MNKSFLTKLLSRLIYPGIWVIITITQIVLLSFYQLKTNYVIYDAVICNIFHAIVLLILWYPVKYSRNIQNIALILLFHILLYLISSLIWMGLGFLITTAIFSDFPYYPEFFKTILPVRIFFSLLIYIVFVLTHHLLFTNNEFKEQKKKNDEILIKNSPVPIEKLTRIIVKKNSEYHCIMVNQIRYIEANGDYVLIYTDSNKYLKDQTMKYWETHLPDDSFVRVHRSFIVNIEEIAKIELYEKETYKVHLKNGDTLKASSTGYKLLKQKMNL